MMMIFKFFLHFPFERIWIPSLGRNFVDKYSEITSRPPTRLRVFRNGRFY